MLILDSCKITSAGHTEDLNRLCSQVTELDLTDNSITNWSEVCEKLMLAFVMILLF